MIQSLRARLFLLSALAVMPAITFILYTAVQQQRAATESTQEQSIKLATLIAQKHEDLAEKSKHLLTALGRIPTLLKPGEECHQILAPLLKTHNYYANIGILDAKGVAYCTSLPLEKRIDLSYRAYYKRAVETGEFSVGDYIVGKISHKPSLNFGYPVYNKKKKLVAVLYVALDLGWLNKIYLSKSIPENFMFVITDKNGVVLVKQPEDSGWVGKSIADTELFEAIRRKQSGTVEFDGFDETERIFSFSRLGKQEIHDGHLYFAIGLPKESLIAQANPILGGKFVSILLGLLATLSIIWFGSHALVLKRLESIFEAIKRIKAGDLDARTGVYGKKDEISQLAVEFDEMASSLQTQIREREATEQEMREARDAADAASRAKSDFVAHMSHEIRTPIGAILGFSELLQDQDVPESLRHQYVRTVQRNADHLLQLVDGILDLSKIEAGVWETNKNSFSVVTELGFIYRTSTAQASVKKLDFKLNIVGSIPEKIYSDQLRLHQILLNLITNAVKFTDRGWVELKVQYQNGRLEFIITDTGKGLTSAQLKKIFSPFVQGDSSMDRKYGGAGLGLYLSKRFAESLGGEVEVVKSIPGEGSTFRVSIETGPLDGISWVTSQDFLAGLKVSKPMPSKIPSLQGLSILVIEDNIDNQVLLTRLLTSRGAKVDVAENAEVGISKALADKYDFLLMDIQLPGMDGLEATRRLRLQGFSKPIVALTAHAMKGEREKCLRAGCDEYATKPVQVNELVSILLKLRFEKVKEEESPQVS